MIGEKCQLCSRLFSKLEQLLRVVFGSELICRCLHRKSYDSDDRVQQINAAAPDCACENHRMSKYSPSIVANDEQLARFIFSPIHLDRKNKPKPSLFSHAEHKGCSIQRESLADAREIITFVSDFLTTNANCTWFGVVVADCEKVRGIQLNDLPNRTVCVYDTAEKSNPAHAEMGLTRFALDDGDTNEMRRHFMAAFDASNPISPQTYRDGAAWAALAPELRDR